MERDYCKSPRWSMKQCDFHLKIHCDTWKRHLIISRAVLGQQKYVNHKCHLKFSRSHHLKKKWKETSEVNFNNILFSPIYPQYYHFNMSSILQNLLCILNRQHISVWTSHTWSTQWPHVAGGYCTGQGSSTSGVSKLFCKGTDSTQIEFCGSQVSVKLPKSATVRQSSQR